MQLRQPDRLETVLYYVICVASFGLYAIERMLCTRAIYAAFNRKDADASITPNKPSAVGTGIYYVLCAFCWAVPVSMPGYSALIDSPFWFGWILAVWRFTYSRAIYKAFVPGAISNLKVPNRFESLCYYVFGVLSFGLYPYIRVFWTRVIYTSLTETAPLKKPSALEASVYDILCVLTLGITPLCRMVRSRALYMALAPALVKQPTRVATIVYYVFGVLTLGILPATRIVTSRAIYLAFREKSPALNA